MNTHTETLEQLAKELLSPQELTKLNRLAQAQPPDIKALLAFDRQLGRFGMHDINCGNTGRYDASDREIFRPLQYCHMYFEKYNAWLNRDIVRMSALHIESLIKRAGGIKKLPLGALLQKKIVRRKLDERSWQQLERFTHLYNAAKHDVNHPKDTHLFSLRDALFAYTVARKLAQKLFPLVEINPFRECESQDFIKWNTLDSQVQES